jgi:hypothetical protein
MHVNCPSAQAGVANGAVDLCRAAAEERAQELGAAWRAIWRGLSGDVGLWAGLRPRFRHIPWQPAVKCAPSHAASGDTTLDS